MMLSSALPYISSNARSNSQYFITCEYGRSHRKDTITFIAKSDSTWGMPEHFECQEIEMKTLSAQPNPSEFIDSIFYSLVRRSLLVGLRDPETRDKWLLPIIKKEAIATPGGYILRILDRPLGPMDTIPDLHALTLLYLEANINE